ncbi:hypothetical protein BDR07DRAFT_1607132 [Suillus spraguei]|nr:hypothetical protein BDR07DRAFT_1607132 [Suillus spraguei]
MDDSSAVQQLLLDKDEAEHFDDDERLMVLAAAIIAGSEVSQQERIDTRHPHRLYLCRPQLLPNPRINTPWKVLYDSQHDRAFITTMGVDVPTFSSLLTAGFAQAWYETPIPRAGLIGATFCHPFLDHVFPPTYEGARTSKPSSSQVALSGPHGTSSSSNMPPLMIKIVVPLSMLLQDVCDGVIELCDPLYDLEHLIDGGVRAYGCSSQHIDGLIPPSANHRIIINLNSHALTHLATIQLPKGFRTTLESTCISNHISFLSTTHVLCSIPFLAHRLAHRLSDVLLTINNTPHSKLSMLTNTSAVYTDTSAAISTKLTYDPVARQQSVGELGIKEWRKQILMLEAALVRRGWLERWDVVLEVCRAYVFEL